MAIFPRCLTRLALWLSAFASLASPVLAQSAKQPITGLVTMGEVRFIRDPSLSPDNSLREVNAHPGVYAGVVILVTWKQIEPQAGRYDFSVIDNALDRVRGYNARYTATPLKAKLRVFAGLNAPPWATELGGGPIPIDNKGANIEIPHSWSMPYRAAWKRLQNALAARYDTDPLVQEVAISSCALTSAEPFHLPLSGPNIQPLLDAGYSDTAMETCLSGAVDDYAAWKHVALDFTFNPMRVISDGKATQDTGFAEGVMRAFRQRLGSRAVIAYHGLVPEIPARAQDLVDAMKALGPPIEFQTKGTNQDMDASVATGRDLGMTEFEVWDTREAGGSARISQDQLHQWTGELRAR